MNATTAVWQSKAKLKLSRLRSEAGQFQSITVTIYEEIRAVNFRMKELERMMVEFEFIRRYSESAPAKIEALKREHADLQILFVDLKKRRAALESRPNPAGFLFHACESVLNTIGVKQ